MKKLTLYAIREELYAPFKDKRTKSATLSPVDKFILLTGETPGVCVCVCVVSMYTYVCTYTHVFVCVRVLACCISIYHCVLLECTVRTTHLPSPVSRFVCTESLHEGKLITCSVVGIVRRKPNKEMTEQVNPMRVGDTPYWKCPFCLKSNFLNIGDVSPLSPLH